MMDKVRVVTVFLCIAAVASAWSRPCAEKWKRYASRESRFSVNRPGCWYCFGDNTGGLDILSFPPSQRVKGVVLRKFGAEITVFPAPSRVETLDQWVKEDLRDNVPIRKNKVAGLAKEPNGCVDLLEVVWHSEVGPKAAFVHTGYYCSTEKGLFSILLTNWEGDPDEDRLRVVALEIAISLRAW